MSTQDQARGVVPRWTLADRLQKSYVHAGEPQARLMDEIDVSANTIDNYRAGRSNPKRPAVEKWAEVTGVNFAWLWFGVNQEAISGEGQRKRSAPDKTPLRPVEGDWTE